MTALAPILPDIHTLTASAAGPVSVARLAENAERLARWRLVVQRALAGAHLVDVAFELTIAYGCDIPTLEALGVPVDLLEFFPRWQQGSRVPFEPRRSGVRLAPAGAALPLETLRLQLSPTRGTVPYALLLLRDLLRQLDRATHLVVVVEPGADLDALRQLATRLHPSAGSRVRFVQLPCVSVFAQDNARAARDAHGQPVLLVPRDFRSGVNRAEDALDPLEAARAFEVAVRRSPFYWEGGNVVHDETHCFVGVDTLAENSARLGLSHEEILAALEAEFGLPVTALGRANGSRFDPATGRQVVSGQASFHIDLDVAVLGRYGRLKHPRALVADAAHGLDFVDDVLKVDVLVAGHFLPKRDIRRHLRAEYEASAAERHPILLEYADELASCGYRVIGMPDLRIDPKMDIFQRVNLDFGFCNVLAATHRKRPAVYHFLSGVRRLDAVAAQRMQRAGVVPVAVSTPDVASALMLLQGGLHCCCGSL